MTATKTITKDELNVLTTITEAGQPLNASQITELFILDSDVDVDLSLPIPDEINERFEAAIATLNIKNLIKEESSIAGNDLFYQITE
jgi:hypothetical protein